MLKEFVVGKINISMCEKDLNITQLAEKCEITRQTMSNLVKEGKGTVDLLSKVFEVLEIEFLKKVG